MTSFCVGAMKNLKKHGRKEWSRRLFTWVILPTSLLSTGCAIVVAGTAGAAAGLTTYAYLTGELKTTQEAPLEETWEASQKAITNLQYQKLAEKKDATFGQLVAQTGDNRRVTITLRRSTSSTTEIKIRVGTFGDRNLSFLILQEIQANLPKTQQKKTG